MDYIQLVIFMQQNMLVIPMWSYYSLADLDLAPSLFKSTDD